MRASSCHFSAWAQALFSNRWKCTTLCAEKAAQSRSAFLSQLESHAFDPARGLYIPLSRDVYLGGKLPNHSVKQAASDFPHRAFAFCFFTNALAIPQGYGTARFDPKSALAPTERATNVGFLVITVEHDCETTDHFEEVLSWTRGGDGEFSRSRFAQVDRELCRFKDYGGYSIVFSGNRSLHFHFIFSTKHLENAPWDCDDKIRLAQSQAAIMDEAHRRYWDTTAEIFESVLQPSLSPDQQLRSLTQWRRSPWAMRRLEEDSEVLGLPAGTIVPQLVIHETVRTRAPRNSQDFLVPPHLRARQTSRLKRACRKSRFTQANHENLLHQLLERCREEWGEYPRPVAVRNEGGEWIINFRNHPDDKNPSTVVKGPFRRLILRGAHTLNRDFFLPDRLSANELCDRLIAEPSITANYETQTASASLVQPPPSGVAKHIHRVQSGFAEPVTEENPEQIISTYRKRLWTSVTWIRMFERNTLVRSPEGIGKTRCLFGEIASEIMDAATNRPMNAPHRFACFAFRSIEQAEAKAEEYRQSDNYRNAVVLRSFWSHYEAACKDAGIPALRREQFPDHSIDGILRHMQSTQPAVFKALEERRRKLWADSNGKNLFVSALTVLFTSHDLAKVWYRSHLTRIWHHPAFIPFANQDYDALRDDLTLSQIVFDEPEMDELLHLIPEVVIRLA